MATLGAVCLPSTSQHSAAPIRTGAPRRASASAGVRAAAQPVPTGRPLMAPLQPRARRPTGSSCPPVRAAATAPPEGIQWLVQITAAEAARSPHFTLEQVALAVGAQVVGAVVLARIAKAVCEWVAMRAQRRVEKEFQITADEVSDEETIGLSNAAIGYLSTAFALSRIRNLFMPLAILFALYKTGNLIEEAMYINGLNNLNWFSEQLTRAMSKLYEIEQWLSSRVGAIFIILMMTVFTDEFKDRAASLILQRQSSMNERFTGWMKMLKPMNAVATFIIWVTAALNVALVLGVDVWKYLLAVGSVSGLAVGIGAQSLISSVLSGVNLFLTVPFLVGDRVELRDGGGNTVLVGVVEGVKLCSTVFRLDSGLPVEVPNSSLTTLLICNQSRTKDADEVEKDVFQTDPRALSMTVAVELPDEMGVADQVPDLVRTIELFLQRAKDVDSEMPINCTLEKFTEGKTASLKILVHSMSDADYDDFMMSMMIGVAKVVETNNCTCRELVPSKQS